MFDKSFGFLQRIGRSFMLPIAILPIAGILLGFGTTFTNSMTLSLYHLDKLMGIGTVSYAFFSVAKAAGQIIFSNIAAIFAIGVAIGMARQEKEVAALAAFVSYLVMNATINTLLILKGIILPNGTIIAEVIDGSITTLCGIVTLQTGVFGGIIVGMGVAFLHNHFYDIELPQVISFFSGIRFVPIISIVTFVFVGIGLFFLWPVAQHSIYVFGGLVTQTKYIGTFIYGMIKRALLPLGLHHVFYMPFWQTALGGTMEIGGRIVEGGQNIFFAQMADPSTVHFSTDACRFFSGEFIFMIFGLPGAAFAMYQSARPERKKAVGSILLSAALTSILTGITEPLEFTFLFVSPLLYIAQVIIAGSCYMVAQLFHIAIGLTFSGGLLDFLTFGVMQGNEKTNWVLVIPIGMVYFFIYYFVFRFLILKFNLMTVGRDENEEDNILFTRREFERQKVKEKNEIIEISEQLFTLIEGLGGVDNIKDIDCCATRLRCTLYKADKLDRTILKKTMHNGLLVRKNHVQIIYGPQVASMKTKIKQYMKSPDNVVICSKKEERDIPDVKRSLALEQTINSPVNGRIFPLKEVDDVVFSSEFLGKGFAVEPEDGKIYSPIDGKIVMVIDTKHAMSILGHDGIEIMVHIGLNTAKMRGRGIDTVVKKGDEVKTGDLLATIDADYIRENGYSLITPVIISNTEIYEEITEPQITHAKVGDVVLSVR